MIEKKFKTGDIVQLKSGSPKMTVMGYDPADSLDVTCTWSFRSQIHEKSFHQDLLTKHRFQEAGIY